jgi:hypothetical protein
LRWWAGGIRRVKGGRRGRGRRESEIKIEIIGGRGGGGGGGEDNQLSRTAQRRNDAEKIFTSEEPEKP